MRQRADIIIALNHADNFAVRSLDGHFDNGYSLARGLAHDNFRNVFLAAHSRFEVVAFLKVDEFALITAHELLTVVARYDYVAFVFEEGIGIFHECFHIGIAIFGSRRQIFLHRRIDCQQSQCCKVIAHHREDFFFDKFVGYFQLMLREFKS